jgi:hypothetical protein
VRALRPEEKEKNLKPVKERKIVAFAFYPSIPLIDDPKIDELSESVAVIILMLFGYCQGIG